MIFGITDAQIWEMAAKCENLGTRNRFHAILAEKSLNLLANPNILDEIGDSIEHS
jgi:hypothetical protein